MDFEKSLKTFTKANVIKDYDCAIRTGYKTGGKVKYFIEITCVKDLRDVLEFCTEQKIDYKILGNGTNILLSDAGYNGALIYMGKLNHIAIEDNCAHVSSGTSLNEFIRLLALNGYAENTQLSGIPASVGGALTMNAGAFNKSISNNLISVSYLSNGKIYKLDKNDCKFGYRKSVFSNKKGVILDATFSLNNYVGISKAISLIDETLTKRGRVQPKGRSCGSVFKNPKGDFAGRLIEGVGLKGFSVGGAFVSNKHANFIITKSGATSKDVFDLIAQIKFKVKEKFGVNLQEEIEYLGSF